MCVYAYVDGYQLNDSKERSKRIWFATETERWYQTADLNGAEIPVTKGVVSTENHILIALTEEELHDIQMIEVTYKLYAEESKIYKQSFNIPISDFMAMSA